ncbi:hypothetical protein [Streptomyces sp. NPDC058240]|uniref:hypothetical protein n=1 Tax=Streptomyces sp. NPDC058240 TaxID=3346396 RepID=UPI0036ED39C7
MSTSSIDVAAVMFQTFRPRQAGKDWPEHAVWPDHGIPRHVFVERKALEPDEEEPEKAKKRGVASPALVPETIIVDHGKPYISEHITSVCQRLGVSIQPARLRTGRDKGPLERFFKTVREGVLEVLPGYKGPDLFSRGERPEDQAFFFLHELEAIIREWVACVYHVRPHRGLVDAHVPGLNLSPAAMFEHGIARAGYIEVPRDPALGFEFLKTEWKQTHHYGVEIRKCRYNGPGLDGYRGETSEYTGPRGCGPCRSTPTTSTTSTFGDRTPAAGTPWSGSTPRRRSSRSARGPSRSPGSSRARSTRSPTTRPRSPNSLTAGTWGSD